jgi:hypothetical protein
MKPTLSDADVTATVAWEPCEDVRPLTGALAEDE